MLLVVLGGIYAQTKPIEININYPILNDTTINITNKLPKESRDTIIAKKQPNFKNGKTDIIKTIRNQDEGSFRLTLKKDIINNLTDSMCAQLERGITLEAENNKKIKLSVLATKTEVAETKEQQTEEQPTASVTPQDQNKETENIKKDVEKVIEDIENKASTIQYEIYVIGGLTLLFILITLFKHKSPNTKEDEERNKDFKDIQSKISSISEDILQLKKNKSSADSLKNIEDTINIIKLEIKNIKKSIETIQSSNGNITKTGNRTIVEREQIQRTDTIAPTPKRIGYTTEPTINGLEEKKILSESNDFCIYEIEFINEQKARYYINRDPRALKNILSVAYMIPGEYNNQTKNQQVNEVKTEESGTLQKLNGKWYMVKPLKFTIL